MATRGDIETAYADAVALADRARAWFDGPGRLWRATLPPETQAQVATETLAVTARLLAAVSWLLDPAHRDETRAADAAPPFTADAGGVPPAVMAGTEGGIIANESRLLVARLLAMGQPPARPPRPVFTASYGGMWRA